MPPRHNRPFQNRRQQIGGSETLPKNLDWLPSVSRSGGSGEGDGDSYVTDHTQAVSPLLDGADLKALPYKRRIVDG